MTEEPVAQDTEETAAADETAEAAAAPAAETGKEGAGDQDGKATETAEAAEAEAEAGKEAPGESAGEADTPVPAAPTKADITMPEDRILEPGKLTISRGPDGHARLEIEGDRCILLVRAVRLFPISHRRGVIARCGRR
jgi:hypothetical protein